MLRILRNLLLCGFAIGALFFAWLIAISLVPMRLPAESVEFSVTTGSSLRSATRQIAAAGVPLTELHFNTLARITGKGTRIKAGSYELAQGATPLDLLQKITSGDVLLAEVLFVEGWTFAQMRVALEGIAELRHDTRGLSDADIMQRLGAPTGTPAEGQFFPDTYLFAKGESDLKLLARAHRLMQKKMDETWAERAQGLPYKTAYEALIMASIVEKETGAAAERATIAGVFNNRLRIGMRLQTDPTVIYGMGERYKGNIRKTDLETDTPFNTYTRAGLPPHPIAMPGLAALRAAVNPASTDAFYFVARGDGSHQFSRTLDEHNRAVSRYQRKGRS
ncbi:MAG: endolytic transglycosylase MltG [Burkholderiales bacterium]